MLLWGLGQPAAHGQNAFVRHGACSLAPDACATADPGGGQGGGGRCAGAGRRIPQAPQGRRCTGRTRRDASPIFFACRATAHRSEQEMGRRRTSTLLRPDPVFTPAPASASHSGAEGQDDTGGGREVPGAVVWESSVLLARFLERAVLREGLLARGSVGRCFAQPLVVGPPRRAQPLRSPPRWQQQLAPYRLKCDKEPLNNKFELGTACDQCKPKSECDIDSMSYIYIGCYCSVKATPPLETMSKEHAMRFPLVGSAMLLSLFLLFKFLSRITS